MRLLVLAMLFSATIAGVAVAIPGYDDVALIAGLAACVALVLAYLFWRFGGRGPVWGKPDARQIIVDGSNVLYWRDNTPDIRTLASVVDQLERLGYSPRVVFDANAGYLVAGKYMHNAAFAQMLSLQGDRVRVVPKGTIADEYILAAARKTGLCIVSNDRYRDWEAKHPEIRAPGRLVRGGWRDGRPWVDIGAFAGARAAA